MYPSSKIRPILNTLTAILLLVAAGSFYRFVFYNAVNVPYFDDLAYLEYILEFKNAPDPLSFGGLFLDKHNGHGVLTAKLAFWIHYLIQGEVNYRSLIISSSFLVLLIFAFFALVVRKNKLPWMYCLPPGLLLFTPAYYENIFWAAASWQYTASIVTGLAMYFCLARKGTFWLASAIVLGFVTTYTNGNGLIGFLVGLLIPLLQENYRKAIIWFISVVLTAVIFYWYYPYGVGNDHGHHLSVFLKTLVSFTGASASYLRHNTSEVVLIGSTCTLALFGLHVWLGLDFLRQLGVKIRIPSLVSQLKTKPENFSLLAFIAWLFATGLGTAWTRGDDSFSAPMRYMIYSVLVVVSLYTLLAVILRNSRFRSYLLIPASAFGMLFLMGTYLFAAPEMINFRNSLWADVYNLKNHQHVSSKIETMDSRAQAERWQHFLSAGLYRFPEIPFPTNPAQLAGLDTKSPASSNEVYEISRDTVKAYGGILLTSVISKNEPLDENRYDNANYIVLKDTTTNELHIFAVDQSPNWNRKSFLAKGMHFTPGFRARIYGGNVKPGWYQIGLLKGNPDSPTLHFTTQQVEIRKIDRIEAYM